MQWPFGREKHHVCTWHIENEGCMEMREKVSRGKFILSSSHPFGSYLLNIHYVPGTNWGAVVSKVDVSLPSWSSWHVGREMPFTLWWQVNGFISACLFRNSYLAKYNFFSFKKNDLMFLVYAILWNHVFLMRLLLFSLISYEVEIERANTTIICCLRLVRWLTYSLWHGLMTQHLQMSE